MRCHKLKLLGLVAAVLLLSMPVYARSCETHFETITDLNPPTYGFPSVWDAKYGEREDFTQFQTAMLGDKGTVIVAGRRLDKEDFSIKSIFITELNRRGRSLMTKNYPPKPSEIPVEFLKIKNGFLLLSSIKGGYKDRRQQARLSWFNDDGTFRFDRIIGDDHYDYEANGLSNAAESGGIVVIIHATNPEQSEDNHGVLVRFTAGGDKLWQRSYRPGIPNEILNVVPINENSFLAVGHIRQDDGRTGAWVMRLAYDGAVNWQRMYPRGAASAFYDADIVPANNGTEPSFVLSGLSEPLDNMPHAAMVMQMDALGEPEWTRYYRRKDHSMNAKWILRQDDGRLNVIVDAEADDMTAGIYDHVRMLSLSRRGDILTDEAYYVGHGARAQDFLSGWNGERIIAATINDDARAVEEKDVPLKIIGLVPDEPTPVIEKGKAEDKPEEKPIQRGWILVGTALDLFDDPCDQP